MDSQYVGAFGREVSALGCGTWGLDGQMWGHHDEEEASAALRLALRQGVNFVDTASMYGRGRAETTIGGVLAELRLGHEVLVATKVPPTLPIWIPSPHIHASEAFPGWHIRQHTEQSLRRLRIDCLALQQLHAWTPAWLGQGDWEETLDRLRQEGKIMGWGISLHDHDADTGIPAIRQGAVHSVQVMHNLFDQGAARDLLPVAAEHGVFIIARSPLYAGGLSGAFTLDTRFEEHDWRRELFDASHLNEVVLRAHALSEAEVYGDDNGLADLALRFALSEPGVGTVIAGMHRRRHVYCNLRVADGLSLDPARMQHLRRYDWLCG